QQRSDPASITFRLTRPDGQLRYLYASGKIITTAQGDATLIGTVQDVTESYQLRQQLEERTRFAEMLIESSVDMIAAYDKNLHYTVWNKRCEEILQLKKEDVLGKYVFDVIPTMKGQKITESLYRGLTGHAEYIPPQASLISSHYYENYVQPLLNETGEVTGVLTITHDITESYVLRQQLEERSQFAETIIDSSVDMIITYDRDLRVTAWNKKSEEVFRLTKQEVLGRYVQDVFPNITGTERLADLQAVLQGSPVQYDPYELPLFGIHANLYLLPLKDHTGQVTGVLSITHDVSDVVQSAARLATLNQSLEEKNKQLADINAELASFSYVASHDLQEPLRKIQSFASRILASEKDRLSEMGQDAFRRIQSAADRMQQLIDDLLTYSRTNTEASEFATADLNQILQEAAQEVSEAAQEKQAVIEADPLPTARVIVFQFRQLLANLLSNALKYQHPGVVPHIRITCTMVLGEEVPQMDAAGKYYLQIKVIDNGIGF
ncbi:MAG: PAS domain-containing protein, partial [Saprospiraceae bacterium]|nr:PAS domain-containing protein [Saprospiraceae bacterium]